MTRQQKKRAWSVDLTRKHSILLFLPIALLYGFLVFIPAYELVVAAFRGGADELRNLFMGPGLNAVLTTLALSLVVTLICLVMGSVIGWTLRITTRKSLQTLLWVCLLAPMAMSVVVKNFSFVTILGKFGLVNWLLEVLGLEPVRILYTPAAVTIGMVYSMLVFATLPLFVTFQSIPIQTIRAARSLGAGRWDLIRTVTLPLATPALFTTGVLVFILSIGFFVTPLILGGPRSTFLASLIQRDIQLEFNQEAAAVKALFLIALAVVMIGITYAIVGRRRFEAVIGA